MARPDRSARSAALRFPPVPHPSRRTAPAQACNGRLFQQLTGFVRAHASSLDVLAAARLPSKLELLQEINAVLADADGLVALAQQPQHLSSRRFGGELGGGRAGSPQRPSADGTAAAAFRPSIADGARALQRCHFELRKALGRHSDSQLYTAAAAPQPAAGASASAAHGGAGWAPPGSPVGSPLSTAPLSARSPSAGRAAPGSASGGRESAHALQLVGMAHGGGGGLLDFLSDGAAGRRWAGIEGEAQQRAEAEERWRRAEEDDAAVAAAADARAAAAAFTGGDAEGEPDEEDGDTTAVQRGIGPIGRQADSAEGEAGE